MAPFKLTLLIVALVPSIVSSSNILTRPLQLTHKIIHKRIEINVAQLQQSSRQQSPQPSNILNVGRDETQFRANNVKRVAYFRMDPKTEIQLDQVDGTLCTHIILAFARIDSNGNLVTISTYDLNYLKQVREFKRKWPGIKVMISVMNEDQFNGFTKIASSTEARQRFAKSAIEFLQRYHLDGIDLDWEFPNYPTTFMGTREFERTGLTKIVKALRSAIVENFYDRQIAEQHELAAKSYRTTSVQFTSQVEPHLLTVAIAGQEAVLRASYELKQLVNLCDWLNVMSYDYFLFKAYAPFTGPNSPLHPIVDHYVPILNKLSFSWTAMRLIEEGLASDKIVMGIPTYARAYRLIFRNSYPAPFTLAVGAKEGQIEDYLNYREVMEILARSDTVVEFDARARVPYLLTDGGYTWISYENVQSVREKVHYILENNLAGYMTWNLNSDDFIGIHPAASTTTTSSTPGGQQANGYQNSSATVTTAITDNAPSNFPLHRAMLDEVILFFSSGQNSVPSGRRASS